MDEVCPFPDNGGLREDSSKIPKVLISGFARDPRRPAKAGGFGLA